MAGDLYLSGWTPPGYRKDWLPISVECKSGGAYLRGVVPADWGDPDEVVAWEANQGDGPTKAIVADYPNGQRIIVRNKARSQSITFTQTDHDNG